MSIDEIIKVVSLSVSLVISLVGFITTFIKVIKEKKWSLLKEALQDFIATAEGFKNFSGEEKKEMVISWAINFCNDNKIKFDRIKISNIIEELVKLTKQVNQREKDKEATQTETIITEKAEG